MQAVRDSHPTSAKWRLVLVAAILCLLARPAAAAITITIDQPTGTTPVPDALAVAVRVASTRELSAVSAAVEGRVTALVYQAGSAQWVGALSLAGLPHGQHTLVVTATDIDGLTQQAQRPFLLDNPPVLTVVEPGANPLARPDLRVVALCTDDAGHCTIRVEVLNQLAASATNSLDAVVTVPGAGSVSTLRIIAIDSAGQQTLATRTLYAESSRFLALISTYAGPILDIADDRALVVDETSAPNRLLLVERSTGTARPIWTETDAAAAVESGRLAPGGALFLTAGTANARLREWRDDVLTDLGDASSLRLAGQYAIWNALTSPCCALQPLMRRDVIAGANLTIAGAGVGNIDNDVAADGDVVYWADQGGRYQIFRYDGGDGSTTPLTSAPDSHHLYVRTDGTNVLFRRNAPVPNPDSFDVVALPPGGELLLSTSTRSVGPDADYQVAGGWFAFTRPGAGGSVQAWRRSPAGVEQQLTFTGTTLVRLDRLLATGELTFQENGRRLVARTSGAPLELGSDAGWPVFLDGEWHVVLGPHLLRFTPTARSLLAEGSTGTFFDTDIVILNPSPSAVDARITYLREDGVTIEETRTFNPRAPTTIHVDSVAGVEATAFATVIEGPEGSPLVVERTMSWDASGYGGHASNAVDAGRMRWLFAEGAQGYFDTYFLMVNDGTATSNVRLTFLREQGSPVMRTLTVPARSRRTVWAGEVAELNNTSFATVVESERPILAERAMYFGRDPLWQGGTARPASPHLRSSGISPRAPPGRYSTRSSCWPTRTRATSSSNSDS